MDKALNMALVGASGVVGQKILQLLEKKEIKIDNLFPLGKSTVGQAINFQNHEYIIGDLDSFDPKTANITIFSAGGSVAKNYAKKFVEACKDKNVVIRTHISDDVDSNGREKFGRLLGEIINPVTKKVLNEELITNGYAVRYMGENKDKVKDQHLKNRKRLIDEGVVKMSYKDAGIL